MCGRFTQRYTWREIHDLYGLTGDARNLQAHYNIAPTQRRLPSPATASRSRALARLTS